MPSEDAGRLDGLRVLITGGSRGIGAACVLMCAAAGANVCFTYLSREHEARQVADRAGGSGVAVDFFKMDVLDEGRVREVFASVAANGGLDGLVNNAGQMGKQRFKDIDSAEWRRMLEGNLTGTFNCIQAALPLLLRSPSPSIVNVSSRLGQVGSAGFAHYAAAKAGVIGLTRALAFELADSQIRVNVVAPGIVETSNRRPMNPGERADKLRDVPLGSFTTPEQVAAVVEFLLSKDASSLTGQTINPSGGAFMP